MPRIVAAEAIIIMSQKFSWASGHMYLRLRSRTRMRVSLAMVLRRGEGVGDGFGEETRASLGISVVVYFRSLADSRPLL